MWKLLWVRLGTLFVASADLLAELNMEPGLAEFHIGKDPELRRRCMEEASCRRKIQESALSQGRCWGFELDCETNRSYSNIRETTTCGLPDARIKDEELQRSRFFMEGDWGYLESRSAMHDICTSNDNRKSILQCNDQLRYCQAKNIFFDFNNLHIKSSTRYRNDVIKKGQVGGNCDKFYAHILRNNQEHKGYLQSWGHELEHFTSVSDFSLSPAHCDVIFDKPTVIMKLDAAVNMYHHFCDFVNLFATQMINGSFDQDIDIIWWDTHSGGFVDGMFGMTWRAFSKRKPVELAALDGKRVCFRNAMLPLLARQRYGLFYNMPLTGGCTGSGLMHAFSHHVLYRLGIKQTGPLTSKVRVKILQRGSKFRRILNIDELTLALKDIDMIDVSVVNYNPKMSFLSQLSSTQNTDVFIGMHGAGLTHLLFLPDWAAVMEIYNCGDVDCYKDLASLRGVRYETWPEDKLNLVQAENEGQNPSTGQPHKKFTNYRFDPEEFRLQVLKMVQYVRAHPKFVKARRNKDKDTKEEL